MCVVVYNKRAKMRGNFLFDAGEDAHKKTKAMHTVRR